MSDVGTTVKVEAGYPIYSKFLDRWFTAETRIRHGETMSDAIIRLEKELNETADKLRKEVEAMRGEIVHETIQGANREFPPIGPASPPVINIQDEKTDGNDILVLIRTAPTLEELKTYKTLASADQSKEKTLYNAYNQRIKELSI